MSAADPMPGTSAQAPAPAPATDPPPGTGPAPDRRILVITYFFPPVGGVGVQRTLKYVTYLPRWGWRAIVVTPRDPAYPVRDPGLLGEIPPGTETHRTLSLEPGRVVARAAQWAGRATGGPRRAAPSGRQPVATADAGTLGHGGERRSGRVRRALRGAAAIWARAWSTILFPDEAIAWLPSAVLAARRIARTRSDIVLYSSSPPVSTHVIAAVVKRLTGRPWVADFRDPWVGNAFADPVSPARQRLQIRVERWIVERADRVVLAMDGLRGQFVERYPELADRFVYIPNGYDPADLRDLPPVPASDLGTFRLVFAGSLYRAHELEVFLAGVERLLARRPELRARLRVDFVGRVNEANSRIAQESLAPGRLDGIVRFVGFVPRPEALARMAGADALLQLMAAEPGADIFVGGKLLEYFAFDRPILAMMPPGEGRRAVDALPTGRTADVDPVGVADALERLVDDPPPRAAADPTGRYARPNLAGELARVLEDVVSRRPSLRGR